MYLQVWQLRSAFSDGSNQHWIAFSGIMWLLCSRNYFNCIVTWILFLQTFFRRKGAPQDEIVVTPSLSGVGLKTKQLTEENADFASRHRYHQSSLIRTDKMVQPRLHWPKHCLRRMLRHTCSLRHALHRLMSAVNVEKHLSVVSQCKFVCERSRQGEIDVECLL